MHIVHVQIKVKSEYINQFCEATIENAKNSIHEEGIMQFDFIKNIDEPDQFVLVEIYRSTSDQLAHRETQHYKVWKNLVADMMAEPRKGIVYQNIYPGDEGWGKK
jgi:(4S)-4-hydroxy-5-phosphonooxypentane-2,3-dione isomerase